MPLLTTRVTQLCVAKHITVAALVVPLLLLAPLSVSAAVTPHDPCSSLPLPFGGSRCPSSSNAVTPSSSSSSRQSANTRTARVALRQLLGYEEQFADRKISRQLRDVVAKTNVERKKYSLANVSEDQDLSAFAQAFAKDMDDQGYFSHETPEGLDFSQRFKNSRYFKLLSDCNGCRLSVSAAENIAMGQKDAKQVVADWIASPEHHDNIIDPDLSLIGVGRQGKYWVQVFVGTKKK